MRFKLDRIINLEFWSLNDQLCTQMPLVDREFMYECTLGLDSVRSISQFYGDDTED